VAIKADGDCCYHLAGVIGSLSKDPGAVASSRAPCSAADLLVTRNQILDNFRRWQESKKPFCTSESDLEAFVLEATGETSATLVARVSGVAKGKDRWGSSADLALYNPVTGKAYRPGERLERQARQYARAPPRRNYEALIARALEDMEF
jgi:hypothetical protein